MPVFKIAVRGTALATALALAASGCADVKAITSDINAAQVNALAAKTRISDAKTPGWVVRHQGVNLMGAQVSVGVADPAWLRQSYEYMTAGQTLSDITSQLSQQIGIKIEVPHSEALLRVTWAQGPVKGFLDKLALQAGLYWKFGQGQILFFSEETKSFPVYLPSSKSTLASSMALSGSSGGSSGGGGGGGTSSISSSSTIDAYDALTQSINAMVSDGTGGSGASGAKPAAGAASGAGAGGSGAAGAAGAGVAGAGGKVVVNSSMGLVTVTASPPVLARVEAFIRGVNERFARNVLIDVKVYNLSITKDLNAGFNLTDVVSRVVGKTNFSLLGAAPLGPVSGAPGSFTMQNQTNDGIRNTNLLIQALSQYGDVSLVTSGQVITANGQPAPLQVGNQISYLASSSTTTTANVGTTTTLSPATASVGFSANFMPMILGDNRILLQYQINLSSLSSLNQITSNGSTIQTPNVASQSMMQQAFVKDGQSIVLLGFESMSNSATRQNGLTGISANGNNNRQILVIILEVHGGKD